MLTDLTLVSTSALSISRYNFVVHLQFFTVFCFVYNSYCSHPFYKLVGLDPGVDVKSLAAMSLALAAKSLAAMSLALAAQVLGLGGQVLGGPSPWPWRPKSLAAMSLALAVTVVSLTPSLLRSSTA